MSAPNGNQTPLQRLASGTSFGRARFPTDAAAGRLVSAPCAATTVLRSGGRPSAGCRYRSGKRLK
jgi:hypothetical protein